MAIPHAPVISNEDLGSDIETKLDANFAYLEAKAVAVESADGVAFNNAATSLSATDVQAALIELANIGLGHMHLDTPYTGGQTLTTTPAKLSLFDTIAHDINGAVSMVVDTSEAVAAHSFTIDKTGLYNISGNVTAEFASADSVTLQVYVNSVGTEHVVSLQGRGAGKPVIFPYLGMANFTAGDVLEVYAFSDAASTSTLITSSHMIVERKALS
jgi:hypothetical protein